MYIDAFLDKKADTIHLAERVNGHRVLRQLTPPYIFYFEDPSGTHESIYGHRCRKVSTGVSRKFYGALRDRRAENRRIFESDLNPVFRALADNYAGSPTPDLSIGFIDIEVGFDRERGYAPPDDPFNPVTAVTIYRTADQRLLTFVLRPPALAPADADAIVAKYPDCVLFDDEAALLRAMLDAIEDVDVITGWNSSAYDLPYLVNRVRQLVDQNTTRRFCLWNQLPSVRKYTNKFGRMIDSYDLVGRVHLDYLDLYAKHNQHQRLSYALNAIGEAEVGETKVPYQGTLDELYNNEFDKFIEYNRQDVMLMVKIDQKLGYIELANQIAHTNCVLLKTTMGSVALIEQAIINEVHGLGKIVPDREREAAANEVVFDVDYGEEDDDEEADERAPVVGAYVAQPKTGLHEHIGAVDINSLYPSAIRALNMSPETLVGQVRPDETTRLIEERVKKLSKTQRAEAWDGVFAILEVQHMHARTDDLLTVDFFDHTTDATATRTMTAKELYDFVFNDDNHLCITANGTIFRTDIDGIIPILLGKWYAERKQLQAKSREYADMAAGVAIPGDLAAILITGAVEPVQSYDLAALKTLVAAGEVAALRDFMVRNGLTLKDGRIAPCNAEFYRTESARYNFLQLAAKIRLNSLYGTLLNEHFLLYDPRLGQSTTLSGRMIVQHMNAKINEVITGRYDYRGDGVIYSDTDSVAADSLIRTQTGSMTIAELYEQCSRRWQHGEKEYAVDDTVRVLGYEDGAATLQPISYVYRHKVKKAKYRVTDDSGRSVVVTGDHSIMIERDGRLIEVKPSALQIGDTVVALDIVNA